MHPEVLTPGALSLGTRLGPYEILAPLGAGGMGEVYRARDTKLDREVAIKVLPERVTGDPEALARFEREAKAVAALSHPNILAIHDYGKRNGAAYAVMELLEGESLRERLARGAIPLRKAVEYALQLALGLAAAHERGIVHRDLKPENVFLTRGGHVKILDFGLARQTTPGSAADDTKSPTRSRHTDPGTVLGTAGYMSPEQVRGKDADHCSDIFSFGAVLYEMLSGRRAFRGQSEADTMSAILTEDPPELRASAITPTVGAIVRRCLEKNPGERFHSAHDVALVLEALLQASTGGRTAVVEGAKDRARRARRAAAALVLVALGAVLGAALLSALRDTERPLPAIRYLTYSGNDSTPAVSPDGRTLAFTSGRDGTARIWLKQLPEGDEVPLTIGPDSQPRFAPDGSTILFVRSDAGHASLYRVSPLGGEPRKLVDDTLAGDWSPNGRQIAVLRLVSDGVRQASVLLLAASDGSGERELARFESQILRHPRWSPDGKTIAVVSGGFQTGDVIPRLVLVGIDGSRRELQTPNRLGSLSSVVWLGAGGEILYFQGDTVMSAMTGGSARLVRQDVRSAEIRAVLWSPNNGRVIDVLPSGAVVFDSRSARENMREITWDAGQREASSRWLTRGNSGDRQPFYSPDGRRVLFSSTRSGVLDIWEISLATGTLRRLTDHETEDSDPALTRDGKRLIWTSARSGPQEIWTAEADGSAARQLSSDGVDAENAVPTPDGRWVLYSSLDPAKAGIWKIRADGSDATRIVSGSVLLPEVSPDGRYSLYVTNLGSRRALVRVVHTEDGAPVPFEIQVDVVRPTGAVLGRARWMPDGRSIAFVGQNDKGVNGVFAQDFIPGQDTSRTRRPLGGFHSDTETETLGIAPDGSAMTVAGFAQDDGLMTVEGLPGIAAPARPRLK